MQRLPVFSMPNNSQKKSGLNLVALLIGVALISSLLFNGKDVHLLSLTWLVLGVWAMYQLTERETVYLNRDVSLLVVALFLLWMVIALYWHPVAWQGSYYNWRLAIFCAALLSTYLLLEEKNERPVLMAMGVIATGVALLTLYQSLLLGEDASGLFVNRNNNAAFLNLFLLPFMATLLFVDAKGTWRWGHLLIVTVLLLAVVQVGSRGALLGLGVAAALLLLLALLRRRYAGVLWVLAALALVAAIQLWVVPSSEITMHMRSSSRLLLWESSLRMLADSSWYGIGNGMFLHLYPPYRHDAEFSAGLFVHNDYLQILLELGLIGGGLLLAIVGVFLHRAVLLVRYAGSVSDRTTELGLTAGIIAVAVHSFFSFNFYKISILLVMGVYGGIVLRKVYTLKSNQRPGYCFQVSKPGRWLVLALLAFLLKPIMVAGYASAVVHGSLGREAQGIGDRGLYETCLKLSELQPDNYIYPYLAARALGNMAVDSSGADRRTGYLQIRSLLNKSRQLNPYAYEPRYYEIELARAFSDLADGDWRETALEEAHALLQMNPRIRSHRMVLAELLSESGEQQQALQLLVEGLVHTDNKNLDYYQLGEKIALEAGNDAEQNRFADLSRNYREEAKRVFNEWTSEHRSQSVTEP